MPLATQAILVGDPGRALMLAQELLEAPKMSNHARGLWGYTGRTPAGDPLTIQSTGIGGPSAAVVLADLAELGVGRAVRVGTCSALRDRPGLGEVVVVARVLAVEGVSRLLGVAEPRPEPGLLEGLSPAGPAVTVRSAELPVRLLARHGAEEGSGGADVHDLQTASLLALGSAIGVASAALLIVVEDPSGATLDAERLEAAGREAGAAVAEALSNPQVEG